MDIAKGCEIASFQEIGSVGKAVYYAGHYQMPRIYDGHMDKEDSNAAILFRGERGSFGAIPVAAFTQQKGIMPSSASIAISLRGSYIIVNNPSCGAEHCADDYTVFKETGAIALKLKWVGDISKYLKKGESPRASVRSYFPDPVILDIEFYDDPVCCPSRGQLELTMKEVGGNLFIQKARRIPPDKESR